MTTFAFFLVMAAIAHGLARLFRISPIPILLLAGFASTRLIPEMPANILQGLLEVGLVFLVFTAGIELNPRRIGNRIKAVALVAAVQFIVIGILGFGLALGLSYDVHTALYLAFALSASSTLVVVRLLKQRQQMFEPFGRLVIGVLLLQDIMIIVGMVVLLRLPEGALAVAQGLGSTALLGGLAWIGHRWIVPFLIVHLELDDEIRLLSIFSLLFAYTGLAWTLDLPLVAGAFLAGYALSSFPANGLSRGILLSLQSFFFSLFFLALGALIVLPGWKETLDILVFAIFVILVTVPLVAAIAERMGYSARAAIESGLLLSQTSEFSLIIALHGWMAGQITGEVFSTIALLTVGLMTLTPYIATDQHTWRLMKIHPMIRSRNVEIPRRHVLMLGYGSVGDAIVRTLEDTDIKLVVVDDDPAVIRKLREKGIACLRGDGSDERLLQQVNAREAVAIVSSIRRVSDTESILRHVQSSKVPVIFRVLEAETAKRLRKLGGRPVVMIDPSIELFMRWVKENDL